jgi:hypothetical protein
VVKRIAITGIAIFIAVFLVLLWYKQPAETLETTKVLAGGGDIATGGTGSAAYKTSLLLHNPGTAQGELEADPTARVITLGDMAYPDGTAADFKNKYTPTWGRTPIKSKTFPTLGNHEYYDGSGTAAAARNYFATGAAHDLSRTYYSEQLNPNLQLIVLDSSKGETKKATGAPSCTTQETFLKNALANAKAAGKDTIATWHHSRWSQGSSHQHDSTGCPKLFADAMVDGGGDVVLTGHTHRYENFGYMNKSGKTTAGNGPFFIVAGTGGAGFDGKVSAAPAAQVSLAEHGIVKVEQHADGSGFNYKFINTNKVVRDSGTIVRNP